MLFDIDGTIIRAGDPAHRAAMEHAMAEVHGTSSTIDGLPLGGRLDRQIVRDALARDGVEPAVVDASLDDLLARTSRRYADLLEVERDDGTRDWECIVVTHPGPALALAPVRVRLGGHDDSVRCGDALVVRSDGTSHVLRGVGDLTRGALT